MVGVPALHFGGPPLRRKKDMILETTVAAWSRTYDLGRSP
jgi:hypothetical protein